MWYIINTWLLGGGAFTTVVDAYVQAIQGTIYTSPVYCWIYIQGFNYILGSSIKASTIFSGHDLSKLDIFWRSVPLHYFLAPHPNNVVIPSGYNGVKL